MKIGYFGSPDIAASLLRQLLDSPSHEVVFVVSNPDKPRGRSSEALPTPVSELALAHGLPLFRFDSLRPAEIPATLAAYAADIYFVFAYGRLIPSSIYEIPPEKTLNLHASVLPLLRGASPVQSALLNGFVETGFTLQYITAELDAGDILRVVTVPIGEDETADELFSRMTDVGVSFALDTLDQLPRFKPERRSQNHALATYCAKLTRELSPVSWDRPRREIHNQIRGLSSWPAAKASFRGRSIKLLKSHIPDSEENLLKADVPGKVVVRKAGGRYRLFVQCLDDLLELLTVQMESKNVMTASDFVNGLRLQTGDIFHAGAI